MSQITPSAEKAHGHPLGAVRASDLDRARSRAPLVTTWVASIASGALGVGAALGGHGVYDPIVALATVSAIGLAWYTYFTRKGIVEVQEREKRRTAEKRASNATALLAELASVTGRLRSLLKPGPAGVPSEFVASPALDHACVVPELFTPTTVQHLLETRRRLQDVQVFLDLINENETLVLTTDDASIGKLARGRVSDYTNQVRIRARWALRKAIELVPELEAEGGIMPSGYETPVSGPDEIALPSDPFPRAPE